MPKHLSTIDLLGNRYGRLVIIEDLGLKDHFRYVKCKCDCGIVKNFRLNGLRMGSSTSCGCYRQEIAGTSNILHGLTKHPLFTIWTNMRQRCHWEESKQYVDYGGRGIIVCDEWRKDFKVFFDWCITNNWNKGLTIDRRNNDGNYEPDNCRIVNNTIQQRNKRSNINYTIDGITKCLKEWCLELGLNYKLTHQRLNRDHIPLSKLLAVKK